MRRTLLLLVLASALSACAFFGKSEPLSPHYYNPESVKETPASEGQMRAWPALRLGRVIGGSHLRERIAYRRGARELGFYEQRRWTERPEVYVRRTLARALYDERGVAHVVSGAGPTLEVELVDFDELLAPKHAVRISMRVALLDLRVVSLERTFSVELPVKDGEDFSAVADAMALALERCVSQVADAVVSKLATTPAPPPLEPADTATSTVPK